MDSCFYSDSFDASTPQPQRQGSLHISRKTSWGTPIPPPSSLKDTIDVSCMEKFDDVALSSKADSESDHELDLDHDDTLDTIAAIGLSFAGEEDEQETGVRRERFSLDDDGPQASHFKQDKPFDKWMKQIQRKATDRRQTVGGDYNHHVDNSGFLESPGTRRQFPSHKKSSSGSSFGFVTAVKTASISLASFSVAPRSRRTELSSRQQRTDLSSKASNRGRWSEDSSYISRGLIIDQAVTNRSLQRRRILEELISTEESYLADAKFLMTVYVTFLASIPSLSLSLRASISRTLNEIVELHEELLGELHLAVPHSEYTQINLPETPAPTAKHDRGHTRWHSLDAVPENIGGNSWLQRIPGMTAEPKVAAAVARVFAKKMNRFFIYEEYGAKYDFMIKDVATAYRTIPQWDTYQRGIEALASSLSSANSQQGNAKKALSIGDLLVKPIQRMCRYPLLFSELLKQTPVYDCPESHMEIESVLSRLREATTEINRATDDPRMKVTMEKTWLLQDRLSFTDMPGLSSQNAIRSLGHIHLCGVLHVSWQTKTSVEGQYLVCLLYRDFLLLATASKHEHIYAVQACISLAETNIEEVDNGRGLQCHTAFFSWKLVFECDHYLYEIIFTACSPKEELEWRSRIADRSSKGSFNNRDQSIFTSLSLPIKAMGPVFGKLGTVARRISIQRATTTLGPGRCQVIISNTNAFKETSSSASINRSQSLLGANRIQVLAPPRAERIRIESLLADVWTRDVLPYPGMMGRARSEHMVRRSASSMMRKLSVASITSNFTKRSGSMVSLHKTAEDAGSGEPVVDFGFKGTPSGPEKYTSGDTYKYEQEKVSTNYDTKETRAQNTPTENHRSVTNSSSTATLRRLAKLQASKTWGQEGQRIVTPPLRTSSQNMQRSVTPRSVAAEICVGGIVEDKENTKTRLASAASQSSSSTTIIRQGKEGKPSRREKGRQLVAGALSLFR